MRLFWATSSTSMLDTYGGSTRLRRRSGHSGTGSLFIPWLLNLCRRVAMPFQVGVATAGRDPSWINESYLGVTVRSRLRSSALTPRSAMLSPPLAAHAHQIPRSGYRGSDFVPWHELPVRCHAAIPSGY